MTAMPTQECMESVILCFLFMFSLCELLYDDVPYIDIQNGVRAAPRVHFVCAVCQGNLLFKRQFHEIVWHFYFMKRTILGF